MPEQMRVCVKCHLELPLMEFSVIDREKGYRRGSCKKCEAARVRVFYATNPDYRSKQMANSVKQAKANPVARAKHGRKSMLKSKYGMTPEQFDQLLASQGSKCALCGSTEHGRKGDSGRYSGRNKWLVESWPVDHNHTTGEVRGILCHPCNVKIGGYEALLDQVGEAALLGYLSRPNPLFALPLSPEPEVKPEPRYVADLPPRYARGQCTICGADQHAGGLCFKHYMRARRKGTTDLSGPIAGAAHHKTILTECQARTIKFSTERGADLARRYGVNPSVISSIRKGLTWKHLEEGSA